MSGESIERGPRRRASRIVRPEHNNYSGTRFEARSGITCPDLPPEYRRVIDDQIKAHRARVEIEMAEQGKDMTDSQRRSRGYVMGNALATCTDCGGEGVDITRMRWKKLPKGPVCEVCYNPIRFLLVLVLMNHLG